MGELKYFLGIEVLRSRQGIILNMIRYFIELILETGLVGAKPIFIPLESNDRVTSIEFDEAAGITNDVALNYVNTNQILVGKLMYATITRPGISYVV